MKVAISGAGGFIGSHLVAMFLEQGADVLPLHTADFASGAATLADKVCGADVVIHLAGASINNLMAPNPTTDYGLTKALGAAVHRPTPFAIPRFLLALRFGSEAAEALASGQYATSKRLPEAGFEFEFKTIEAALNNLYNHHANG